jgi:hypothetical protein
MAGSQRREDKKRRRQKRVAKREWRSQRHLQKLIDVFEGIDVAPGSFPGAADVSLERPDWIKRELCEFAESGEGGQHLKRFERQAALGIIGPFHELDHWCMEEFFYHGAPESNWNPIDLFLAANRERFPLAAQRQIALWKQARLGFHEVGDVADDLVALRELDPLTMQPAGGWVRAISLNVGGVGFYESQRGLINLTYVAPWAPDQNIHCAMGYGLAFKRDQCDIALPLIFGMRNPSALTFPLPWKAGNRAKKQFLHEWRRRDWHAWMKERVRVPFNAVVFFPDKAKAVKIDDMVTRSAEEAARMGIYFSASLTKAEVGVFGATAIQPIDIDSPNALVFAEYQEYRNIVGPPPGIPS